MVLRTLGTNRLQDVRREMGRREAPNQAFWKEREEKGRGGKGREGRGGEGRGEGGGREGGIGEGENY